MVGKLKVKAVLVGSALAAMTIASSAATAATTVNWADLTATTPGGVVGTINVGGTPVAVTYAGAYAFAQTNGGTNYWTGSAYTNGDVTNAPPTSDIIALNFGGLKTITFSQAVTDPYLALISWNSNSGTFNQPFQVVSQGCGYWGCGSFTNVTSNSFVAQGELHGVIRFNGTFTSVSFTDQSEYWHGIQIGVAGLASAVPEPAAWAMMIGGLGMVGGAMRSARSKRKLSVRYA